MRARWWFLLFVFVGLMAVAAGATAWFTNRDPLPGEVRIAAGKKDGLYFTFAQEYAKRLEARIGRPVRVVETAGSEANVELLRSGGAELALVQTASLTPEGVAGVAPLFPEPLHILARKPRNEKEKPIRSPADLEGRRVARGLEGSSTRQNAATVLAHYGIPANDPLHTDEHFAALAQPNGPDAAFVTTGWMNPLVADLLRSGQFELVALPDPEGLSARHPWFAPTTLPRGLYDGKPPLPAEPVRTVAVTALLAGRSDAPDALVREALGALYETNLQASFPALLAAKAAKEYDGAAMHPAVAKYHDPAAAFKRVSHVMELASKSKEAVFGAGAAALVLWGWLRRRREQAAAAADFEQKRKLDEFIGQTLTVELEQMEVTDPEQLRAYLRRVTHIKQAALKELTSEKVRGDQLFAIFLSQCAALSEKIQMRMIYGTLAKARGHPAAPGADGRGAESFAPS